MLLKHLYDYAHTRNLLDDPAFAPKAVRWIIDLDSEGNMIGQGPTQTGDEKRGKEYPCPWSLLMDNSGKISEFLTGGIDSIFGLSPSPEKPKAPEKLQAKNAHFWKQISDSAKSIELLSTVLKFKDFVNTLPPFLHQDGNGWIITSADGKKVKLGTEIFSFRVNDSLLLDDYRVRNWWRERFKKELNGIKADSKRGLCIITGQADEPIAETHSVKIMRVPDGQPSGASLVSFDKPAFSSYGFSKSQNCPTSVDSALAYCLALNHLIKSDDSSLPIGGTVLCFWANKTESAGNLFSRLLNKPDPQFVAKFMKSPWGGIEHEFARKDQFIAVSLKGCSGRVAVSHWLQEPLDQAVENFEKWFADLDIQVPPKSVSKATKRTDKQTESTPLSIYRLASMVPPVKRDKGASKPDMDRLQPEVPTQLYRAALEGIPPSISLISPILNQLRSRLIGDENYKLIYDQSRFALLKLILNRNRKESDMEIRPQLTADTDDPAYNCGRLLSVLSETQKKAHDYKLEGAGVVERYFGTSSISPASVFPLLLRLNRHHLEKIRKSPKWGGDEIFLKDLIKTLSAKFRPDGEKLPPEFPRTLNLQKQGRFCLGFYQQQAEDARARIAAKILNYLEETDAAAHTEALALQASDPQAFYEKVSQHYGSVSFKEWSDKKQEKAKASSSNAPDLFNNE